MHMFGAALGTRYHLTRRTSPAERKALARARREAERLDRERREHARGVARARYMAQLKVGQEPKESLFRRLGRALGLGRRG